MFNNSQKIDIFDTTLRDGQQCPGAGMSIENNLIYAQLAKQVNIDILEAGFPAASQEDFAIVKKIAEYYAQYADSPIVAALCQMREQQVITTIKSLQSLIPSQRARLHIYVPVDPQLMKASIGSVKKDTILKKLNTYVKMAHQAGCQVEFSPEGYSRMDHNFNYVTDLIEAAISAGASIINCPDTIGGGCYLQGQDFFVQKMIKHAKLFDEKFPDRKIIWSTHCHNDYGLALINSMQAIFDGPATQIEGCFNGIGERAGNVSLEQCIMYLKAFGTKNNTNKKFHCQARTQNIKPISDFVAKHMLARQAHWPISGENAARHSSGGHTNAILKNPQAYQPFNPQDVGQKISFVFGPLSGSNHAQSIIINHGYACSDHEKVDITQYIKHYFSHRRKGLTDKELMQAYYSYRSPIKVFSYQYQKHHNDTSIKISCEINGTKQIINTKSGAGGTALMALHKALCTYVSPINIQSFHSQSQDEGEDAISHATITVIHNNMTFIGRGKDLDIEVSALKSLVNVVNRIIIHDNYAITINKQTG